MESWDERESVRKNKELNQLKFKHKLITNINNDLLFKCVACASSALSTSSLTMDGKSTIACSATNLVMLAWDRGWMVDIWLVDILVFVELDGGGLLEEDGLVEASLILWMQNHTATKTKSKVLYKRFTTKTNTAIEFLT